MDIRNIFARFRKMRPELERGQALAEYWPTIAGAMAITVVIMLQVGGGAKASYCKIVDAVGDKPEMCEEVDDVIPENPVTPDENNEEPHEATCAVTFTDAESSDPATWSGAWDGTSDVLTVVVDELDGPITWSVNQQFVTDPSSSSTEIDNGTITENGSFEITIPYPAQGDWGPVATDGSGKYEAQSTVALSEPCGTVSWNRWYNAERAADMAIAITHDVSPVTQVGETLTYTVTVTNNGPNNAEISNGEGVIVEIPVPAGVSVISKTPSQGECDPQIICDLGEMEVGDTVTIAVVTTVADPSTCELTGTTEVKLTSLDDPDPSNNTASTDPYCQQSDVVCVDYYQFGVATDFNSFSLGDHYSPNGSDVEGRVAAAGDATFGSYTIGLQLDSSVWGDQNVLVVGNNLTYNGGDVHGNAVAGGTTNISGTSSIHGEVLSGSPIDFSQASSYLKSLSSMFGNTTANGTAVKQYSALLLDGSDPDLNVFNVESSQFSGISEIKITIPDGSTALVNVRGSDVTFFNGGYWINGNNTPSSHAAASANGNSKVVYNLPDATSVTLQGGINGAILAPNADVTFGNGVVWGTVVSGSFSGGGQINYVPFEGCVPPMSS